MRRLVAHRAQLAINRAGGKHRVAKKVGVTWQAIHHWTRNGVSRRHIVKVGRLVRHTPRYLRPDLY